MTTSRIPLDDLARIPTDERTEIDAAIARVIDRAWYVMGPEVEQFEREFAEASGTANVIGVGNGTDALELSLRTVGVGAGDEVIVAANAGGYASTAARSIGARPVFADIDRETLLIDPAAAKSVLTGRTRAVVCTHLYGSVVDVDAVRSAFSDSNVAIVEDCAQAHLATMGRRAAGTMGDIAAYSSHPTKNLGAIGDAGAVTTDDADLADAARELCQYGWRERYDAARPFGRNSRMDEVQAAVLRARLPSLRANTARRVALLEGYERELGQTVRFPQRCPGHVAHLAVALVGARSEFQAFVAERGVSTAVHYPIPDHRQPAFSDSPTPAPSLPNAEWACARAVSLPCFPELTDGEHGQVVDAVPAWGETRIR